MSGELYKERVKLFKDTVALKKTERIPNLSNFFTWKIFDSEFGLKEALYDYKKMEKLVCDFHERYQFDAYMDLGVRNPMAVTDALGGGFSVVNDEKESISFVDHVLMDSSEYKDYAKDPHKYNKLLFQRKFPNLTTQAFGKGIQEFSLK